MADDVTAPDKSTLDPVLSLPEFPQVSYPAIKVDRPLSLLDEYRQKFPDHKDVKDEDILAQFREQMAPYVSQERFDALARDPYGRTAIAEEAKKPPNGLQKWRDAVPEAKALSDDAFLKVIYDQLGESKKLDPNVVSLGDFKDLMSPQSNMLNTAWHTWQSLGRGAESGYYQMGGMGYTALLKTPEMLREGFSQVLNSMSFGLQAGTQMKKIGDASLEWWNQKINDLSQGPRPEAPGVPVTEGIDPTITPKDYGDLWRQFVNWVKGQGDAQYRQAQVDAARQDVATQLAGVTGGQAGATFARIAGATGQKGSQFALGMLMYSMPGVSATTAAITAGVLGGSLAGTQAVQAHHDNILLEEFQGAGLGAALRYNWASPNGRGLTMLTNVLADSGEDTVNKWLRGEKIDWFDEGVGFGLDLLAGHFTGHRERALTERGIPSELTFAPPRDLEPISQMEPGLAQLTTGPYQPGERGFLSHASPQQWDAATIEFDKAVEAREKGDYKAASQFMDRALAVLPSQQRREIARSYIQYAREANAPVQVVKPDKSTTRPKTAEPPETNVMSDIINHTIFGLTPKPEEAAPAPEAAVPTRPERPVFPGAAPRPLEITRPFETRPIPELERKAEVVPTPAPEPAPVPVPEPTAEKVPVSEFGWPAGAAPEPLPAPERRVPRVTEPLRPLPYDPTKPIVPTLPAAEVPEVPEIPEVAQPAPTEPVPEVTAPSAVPAAPTPVVEPAPILELTAHKEPPLPPELEAAWANLDPESRAQAEARYRRLPPEDQAQYLMHAASVQQSYTAVDNAMARAKAESIAEMRKRRGQAGYTIPWINEAYDYVRDWWVKARPKPVIPRVKRPPGIPRGFATERWYATFEPQHPSRGIEAVKMHQASVLHTAEMQQRIKAIPVAAARRINMEKVLKGGETVLRRLQVFNKLSDAELREILSQAEEGPVHTGNTQVDFLMNVFYRPLFQALNAAEKAVGFVYKARDFYFYHALSRQEQERFVRWYDNYITSDPRWTKERKLPTYRVLFEAGFRPVTLNPERLFQMRLASSMDAIRKVMTLRDAAEHDAAIRKDFLTPEERASYQNNPQYTDERAPNGEDYFLTNNARQVIQNAWEHSRLYTDFWFSPGAKFLSTWKGVGGAGLLAWSIAHPFHIALTYASNAPIRFQRALLGRNRVQAWNQALADLMNNPKTTNRLLNKWRGIDVPNWHPDEEALFNDLKQMGINLDVSEYRQLEFVDRLREMWPQLRGGKTEVAAKLTELGYNIWTSEPIRAFTFKQLVPSLKASAAIEARRSLYANRPELMHDEFARRAALVKAGGQIDARFGELNYANVYWSRLFKDLGQMGLLSAGWTTNTLQFVGGAVHDLSSNIIHIGELRNKLAGRPSEHTFLTDRILFTINYCAMTMIANAMRQFIWTGLTTGQPQIPTEGKDYVFPKIYKDNGGQWVRGRPIEFTTELGIPGVSGGILQHHIEQAGGPGIGYLTGSLEMAMNKINPFVSTLYHDVINKNYFGTELRSRFDPPGKQVVDFVVYALSDPAIPISFKQQDWVGRLSSALGLPAAARWVSRTPTENRITDAYYAEHPMAQTREAQTLKDAHVALANAVRNKDQAAITRASADLQRMGVSEKGIRQTVKFANRLPEEILKTQFKALDPMTQKQLFRQMTPTERKFYYPFLKETLRPKTPEAARRLPAGTEFFDPDGNLRTRP